MEKACRGCSVPGYQPLSHTSLTVGLVRFGEAVGGAFKGELAGQAPSAAASIIHSLVELRQRDSVLDDGRDGRGGGRGPRLVPAAPSPQRRPADVPQRPGEEVVGFGSVSPAVVAEEGGVPEDVPAAAHVHGVAEVAQRRADHVRRQLRLQPPLAMRA